MKYALLSALLLAGAACVSAPDPMTDRGAFYDRLGGVVEKYNHALDTRDFPRQSSIELELTRYTTPKFDWLSRDAIEETDVDRRNLAVWGLAFCRQIQSADVLIRALDDPDPIVRGGAAFGVSRQSASNPPLAKLYSMMDDARPYVRQSALFALKQLMKAGEDHGQLAKIIARLDDDSPDVRNEAAQVLGRIKIPAAIEPLCRKALSDPSPLVRTHGALSLGGYAGEGPTAIPFLVEALRDTETGVVEAAWWALKKISGLDYDRTYHYWRDWYEQDQRRFEYLCRDHPGTIKETAGFCNDCGKRLEKQPKPAKKPGEEDVAVHVCPNHPEVTGGPGGKCSKCKSELVPKK